MKGIEGGGILIVKIESFFRETTIQPSWVIDYTLLNKELWKRLKNCRWTDFLNEPGPIRAITREAGGPWQQY